MAKKKMALVDVESLRDLLNESRAYFALRDVDSWGCSEKEYSKWLDEISGLSPLEIVQKDGYSVIEIDEENSGKNTTNYLFLDCEHDGYKGALLSMALYNPKGVGNNFYFETDGEVKDPWVVKNVIPVMINQDAKISIEEAREDLEVYLSQFKNGVTIVADFPTDIQYFCDLIVTGPGRRLNLPRKISFELNLDLSSKKSIKIHNAFYDAIAIYEDWLEKNKTNGGE